MSNRKMDNIILILMLVIVIGICTIIYMVKADAGVNDIVTRFTSNNEYNVQLQPFVTNLKSERKKSYLNMEISLMYENKKEIENIEASTQKIRDIILRNLREYTAEEIMEVTKTDELKLVLLDSINESLDKDVIKEIYFTNIIVQ